MTLTNNLTSTNYKVELQVDIDDAEKRRNLEQEYEDKRCHATTPSTLESNVEKANRAPGRPRIVRTGSRGRPRKQYHLRSKSNSSVDNQEENVSHDTDTNEETDEGEHDQSEQNESDFQTHQDGNEICDEVNIIQAFMGTMEISIKDAIEGPHAKE